MNTIILTTGALTIAAAAACLLAGFTLSGSSAEKDESSAGTADPERPEQTMREAIRSAASRPKPGTVSHSDIEAVRTQLEDVLKIEDRGEKLAALGDAVLRGIHSDPAATVLALEDVGIPSDLLDEAGCELIATLIEHLARTGIRRAVDWIEHQLGEASRADAYAALVPVAAESDLPLALEIVNRIPVGDLRNASLQGLVRTWAEIDLDGATRFVSGLTLASAGNEYDRDGAATALAALADVRAELHPQAALDWALQTPDSEFRKQAARTVVTSWALDAPAEGSIALSRIQDAETRNTLVPAVAAAWSDESPAEAARWLSGLQASGVATTAMSDLMQTWIHERPAEASTWIDQNLTPGPLRDSAVMPLIRHEMTHDPESAMAWAATLSDNASRASEMHLISASRGAER